MIKFLNNYYFCSNMKEIQRINEREIDLGVEASEKSWHKQYSESAYVFVGKKIC